MPSRAVILGLLFTALVTAPTAEPRMPFKADVVGQGPAIIFIPGLNSSGAVWEAIVRELRDRHTCHVLTLAGFAGEPAIAPPFLPPSETRCCNTSTTCGSSSRSSWDTASAASSPSGWGPPPRIKSAGLSR
jgi:pimeloyl-ACP methyl ester carboxylesterase